MIGSLKLKFLVAHADSGQFGGTGRHTLQRVIAKGAAVGSGGHNAFFGADHLVVAQASAMGTIGTSWFDFLLK
jgi:hypothetical protein